MITESKYSKNLSHCFRYLSWGISITYRNQVEGYANYLKIDVKEPSDIDFLSEIESKVDILVLSHQPGIGKTYNVMKFIGGHPNSFYFTNRHDVIQEMLKNFNFKYTWWEGIGRKCSYERFKDDKKTSLPYETICANCKKYMNCDYWNQFTKSLPIFAVFEHIPTKFKGWLQKTKKPNRPDIVFLDESKLLATTYNGFDRASVRHWMSVLGVDPVLCNSILNPGRNYKMLSNRWGEVSSYFKNTIINAYNQGLPKLVDESLEYKPSDILRYLEWANIYNDYNRDLYSTPLWYYAFDLVKEGILPVFLDASFNLLWFNYMIECYQGEIGFGKDQVNVVIYGSEKNRRFGDDATVVYNMKQSKGSGGWYPKSSWITFKEEQPRPSEQMEKWLKEHMKTIIEIFGLENIGVISFKELVKYPRLLGIDALSFGDLRSSNELENKQVIVILGTFHGTKEQILEHLHPLFYEKNIKDILERRLGPKKGAYPYTSPSLLINPYEYIVDPYLDKISTDEFEEWLNDKHKMFFFDDSPIADTKLSYDSLGHEVYPVWWLQKAIWDDEMYQAFHRNRGLRESKIIFIYGWLPPQIINEFKVVTVKPEDEKQFWKDLKNKNKSGLLHKILSDVDENKGSKDIAERYNINKKQGGRDTKTVSQLKKLIKDLKDRAKYPNK